MRLLVVRHGATQHNLDARFTGQIDAPLSDLGQAQAVALAERLASVPLDAVVTSDLLRARATAAIVAERQGIVAQTDRDLREISMGAWEGLSVEVVRQAQTELYARVLSDPLGESAPPDGETWAAFARRVERALARWRDLYPNGTVLWVTHGGVVSVLLVRALGLDFSRRDRFRRANTGLFELEYDSESVTLARANDTCHLDAAGLSGRGERSQAL